MQEAQRGRREVQFRVEQVKVKNEWPAVEQIEGKRWKELMNEYGTLTYWDGCKWAKEYILPPLNIG